MKSRSSGYSSDSEKNKQKDDLSILRKPIHTALSGFLEAKKAYDNGTDEIRRLLSRECDIIYECNLCRNVFRSLTNFISHKRVYCRNITNHFTNSFNPNQNGFIDQDVSTIIQAEQDFVSKAKSSSGATGTGKDIVNTNKDLSSIIERLVKREQTNRLMKLTDFYEQVNSKLTQDELLQKKHVLQLDRVPNSSVAVYQTVKTDESDNIKAEVNEVHSLINMKTILGPDGKALSSNSQISPEIAPLLQQAQQDQNQLFPSDQQLLNDNPLDQTKDKICEICKLKFTTEKTLKLHIQAKHITSTFVFQCPSCSLTFLQPAAVIRHLSNDHKKSTRRIRMMRESIYKRRVRLDEVHVKGPSRELARLQTDKEKREAENKAWLDNIERADNSPMCTYCGKTFERKAVLTTHLNNCQMKNKASTLVSKKIVISDNATTSTTSAVLSKSTISAPAATVTIPPTPSLKLLAEDFSSKSHSSSNSVDSFDLEHRYDINGDSKDSTEMATVKEEVTIKENRRKRRKPPKMHLKNEDFDSDTLNEMFANLGKSTDELSLKTVSLDTLTNAEAEKQDQQQQAAKEEVQPELMQVKEKEKEKEREREEEMEKEPLISEITETLPFADVKTDSASSVTVAKTKFRASHKQLPCLCKICEKRFDALSNLRRHISMFHYRSRKFGCKLCDYRAFRKYDVINHLGSSHAITGEKEATVEYIMVHEEKYLKDDVDEDIVLITGEEVYQSETIKPEEKRQRRSRTPRQLAAPKVAAAEPIIDELRPPERLTREREKFTRSTSQQSMSSVDDSIPHKRPIRNRVKPVNKDFVYDLSNLLKKDMLFAERESLKTLKRRNTSTIISSSAVLNDDSSRESITTMANSTPPNEETERPQLAGIKRTTVSKELIRGAAQKIAALLVSQGRAAFATLPELPTERPLMRSRLMSTYKIEEPVPVIQTVDLEESQYKATLSEDSFIDKFSKRRKIDFKMKPRLSLPDSPLNSLLLKVDFNVNCSASKFRETEADIDSQENTIEAVTVTTNGCNSTNSNQNGPNIPDEDGGASSKDVSNGIPLNQSDEKDDLNELTNSNQSAPINNVLPFVEPQPSIPVFTSPPPTPTKRITLFQRLKENKTKKLQDSLLRSALEN